MVQHQHVGRKRHHGAAIAEGTPETVVREPAVVQSYLGAEAV